MNRQTRGSGRAVISCALAGLVVLGVAACNQEPGKLPMKPSQGFNSAPNGTQGANPGSPTGGAVAASDRTAVVAKSTDGSLAAKVKSAIASEPALGSMALDVSAQDGVVTLHGTADTDAERERAAKIALNVDGVRSVRNELVIVRGS